ncbi:MAG: hypothetical protein PHQ60_00590 [Sideroxydans sp.]|nr:hypothetical protein [Sideroxydans sp.]
MNLKALKKIKRQLTEMGKSPFNRKPEVFISIAKQLGRTIDNRGKEPTYTRGREPALSPPLSIPNHPGDIKPGTARSIIDALLSDVDDWEIFLREAEDDEEE